MYGTNFSGSRLWSMLKSKKPIQDIDIRINASNKDEYANAFLTWSTFLPIANLWKIAGLISGIENSKNSVNIDQNLLPDISKYSPKLNIWWAVVFDILKSGLFIQLYHMTAPRIGSNIPNVKNCKTSVKATDLIPPKAEYVTTIVAAKNIG